MEEFGVCVVGLSVVTVDSSCLAEIVCIVESSLGEADAPRESEVVVCVDGWSGVIVTSAVISSVVGCVSGSSLVAE